MREPLPTGLDEGMDDEQLDTQTKKNIPAPLQRAIQTTNCPPNYDELMNFDLVVLSPGVPLNHRLPTQAIACGIPVTSELAFAASMLPKSVEIVCVTGTNGKSTTTTFLAQMLSAMGHRVWAGGNLGQPLSKLAYDTVTDGGLTPHYAAVEVSSYQLEPAGEFPVSAACVLNVGADHLDRHQTLQKYAQTKAKLVDYLEPGSLTGIISEDVVACCGNTRALQGCARIGSLPGVIVHNNEAEVLHSDWRRSRSLDLSALRCPGTHNMVNAAVRSASFASAGHHPVLLHLWRILLCELYNRIGRALVGSTGSRSRGLHRTRVVIIHWLLISPELFSLCTLFRVLPSALLICRQLSTTNLDAKETNSFVLATAGGSVLGICSVPWGAAVAQAAEVYPQSCQPSTQNGAYPQGCAWLSVAQ